MCAHRGQKVWDPLELELSHVGAKNWTWVLEKSIKGS